jgi:hypothetical protein
LREFPLETGDHAYRDCPTPRDVTAIVSTIGENRRQSNYYHSVGPLSMASLIHIVWFGTAIRTATWRVTFKTLTTRPFLN